jgi:hypothetical protein
MADKPKNLRGITPAGLFQYPFLVKPDYGNEKFPDPDGTFKVNLRLTEAEAQPLLELLQPVYDQAMEDGKEGFSKLKVEQRKKLKALTENPLYAEEYDKETEEPTGVIVFKFTSKASGTNAKKERWERTIPLFDAKGKPFKPRMVGGGSLGKISFEAAPYFVPGTGSAGVKLYLNAVQILDLVESGGGRDASAFGFGAEEGYEVPEEADSPFDTDTPAGADGGGEDTDNF